MANHLDHTDGDRSVKARFTRRHGRVNRCGTVGGSIWFVVSACSGAPESLKQIAVWPDTVIVEVGGEVSLEAQGYDQFFHRLPLPSARWRSQDDAVAVVHRGRVRGRGTGTVAVEAIVAGDTARAVVVVVTEDALPTLSRSVQPVLTARCATSGCHTGGDPPMGLNLEVGQTYVTTVQVQSVEVPDLARIRPFDTRASWLLLEAEGRAHDGRLDVRYPAHRDVSLTSEEVARLRAWVRAGAPNN